MEDYVYDLFTTKNHIPLHSKSLNMLKNYSKPQIDRILIVYKQQFGNNFIYFDDFNIFMESFNKEFQINEIKRKTFYEKFLFLLSKGKITRKKIKNLDDEFCFIFGLYEENMKRIQDETGSIKLDMEYELPDGIFVYLEGRKIDKVFKVENIYYPEYEKKITDAKNGLVLIFSGYVEIKKLKTIINSFDPKPEVIISICDDEMSGVLFIISDLYMDIKFLGMYGTECEFFDLLGSFCSYHKKTNLFFSRNPCELTLFNRKIIVQKDKIISKMKNKMDLKSESDLFKIMHSQHSYNFIKMKDFFYLEIPDLVLINEDHNEINIDVDGCRYVSFGAFHKENGVFVVYNTIDNTVDISQFPID